MHIVNNKAVADDNKRLILKEDRGFMLNNEYIRPQASIVIRFGKQITDAKKHAEENYLELTSEEMQKLFEEYEKELREAQAEEVSTEQDS